MSLKKELLAKLRERRANPPEQIDNASLYAGSPMFFYCLSCSGEIIVPEAWIFKPDLCSECTRLQKLGWLDEEDEYDLEELDDYDILGVTPDVTDVDIKRVYKELVKNHHPDTLTSKGLPQVFIDNAEEELKAINEAYGRICRERGIN